MAPKPAIVKSSVLGPAMSRLTTPQQMFVCFLFEGAETGSEAARRAGYGGNNRTLATIAYELTHNPKIHDAMVEESRRRDSLVLPLVSERLHDIARNPQHTDHFKALKLLRDDTGVSRVMERTLNVKVTVSQEEKLEKVRAWAIQKGLDPAMLIGETIDGEFEEVSTEEPEQW